MRSVILNNNVDIPVVGLGTYPLNKLEIIKVLFLAELSGYRYIDTAAGYGNERWLGFAMKLCPCQRKNLFISSKISNTQQKTMAVAQAYERSCRLLGVDKLDLYLMHWPYPELFLDTWREMEDLYLAGAVRAIGVCNCHEHHLDEILRIARVIPAINQIELHPLLTQKKLVKYCHEHHIRVVAYSPVARMHEKLVGDPLLLELARKYHRTVPQIILRWDYQNGVIVIPKSSSLKRLRENINIFDFELSSDDMHIIDAMNCDFRVRFNPDTCDYEKL